MLDNMKLKQLGPGMLISFGGDRVVAVSKKWADSFQQGDRLIVVQETGDLLHILPDTIKQAAEHRETWKRPRSQIRPDRYGASDHGAIRDQSEWYTKGGPR